MTPSVSALTESHRTAGNIVRLRTFLLTALPLLIPLAFTFFYVPYKQEQALLQTLREKAEVLLRIFAANAAPQVQFEDSKGLTALLRTAANDKDIVYIQVVSLDGKPLATYGDLRKMVPLRDPGDSIVWADEDAAVHAATAVRRGEEAAQGILQLAVSKQQLNEETASFRRSTMIVSVLVLGIAFLIAVVLGRSFSRLFDQLRNSLFVTARSVDEVVNQLASVTAQQTAAAAEESSALHETNATASNVNQAASSAAQRASTLIEGGVKAEEGASSGLDAASSATTAMREVREQMSTITNTIGALSERAAAIGEIAATVALLAERSNLLALNAAIEAARAGPQGRGFTVVAQEMRSLADGSNRSAGQVKSIIMEIQSSITRAVGDVREGERRVLNAEQLSERASDSIRKFAQVTREFATMGKEIAAGSNQQRQAIEQMVESIGHATQAGTTQLETTKQVEETAVQLRQLSRELLQALTGRGGLQAEALDASSLFARGSEGRQERR